MKKLLLMLMVVVITLSACEPQEETDKGDTPVFESTGDLSGLVNDSINLFQGLTVTDTEDGDLTQDISITNLTELPLSNASLTTEGTFVVKYFVKDSDGNQATFERNLVVTELASMCDVEKEGYTLTFCDDFLDATNTNAQGIDLDKWDYQEGNGAEYGIPGWGNSEKQYYREENSLVEDGFLVIEAKLEDFGGVPYTSSKLVTKDRFAQTYGRFEARIKLPLGNGLWPAFWMMPEDNVYGGWARSGEIDIMEAKGRLPYDASGAIHYGGSWPNNVYQSGHHDLPQGEGIDTFHVYAVEWTSESISWYIDDTLVWTATEWYSEGNEFPAPFNQDFFMILNLAVGGHFDNHILPPDSLFDEPVQMFIDYVRVYQYTD
ncbi:glycoside hydrolase family 16 protein [Candidatus Xianfuyuplasma coldseepsis]|uniref:Family 16 glycosylhydrolase n=1 Tax=Candidatus Xianfuyuplasma coldseepsis TaxID=2782163 RepID=A0A7L7KRV3_9MOLU|nr:glycoside hydrolase family 16 protein [Xianfuyuplasma coldseepsis]QMS84684.1 family 16 glycosylhydrolase [Xianfuyuplasma coldseepsis]